MSQTPSQCPQCGTPLTPGQRFCPNCGATAPSQVDPTVAASSYPSTPSNPNYPSYQNQQSTPSAPNYAPYGSTPSNPNQAPYPGTPSNPNQAPYGNAAAGSGVYPPTPPNTSYSPSSSPYNINPVPPAPPAPPPNPYYTPPSSSKKRSPLVPILIGLVVLLLLGGGGAFYFLKLAPGHNGGGILGGGPTPTPTFAASSNLNLTATYASDAITFTSLQQQDKFSDDQDTTYNFGNTKPNYVRLNFSEKQTGKSGSYFGYIEAFHLILPDGKTSVAAVNSQQLTGPEQGVQRTNWVDFKTDKKVDLSKLSVVLGTADEAQITVPLQDNADVTKYAPKSSSPGTKFQYAGMDWTLKTVTQSLYDDGKQAKTGQVYISIDLVADNNTSNSIYLSFNGFLRLKAGSAVQAPEYSSSLDKFDIIEPNTTGITGTAIFLVTPTSDNKYTLDFQAGQNIDEKTVDFQVS